MTKKIESHNLVVKSNQLIEANYRLEKFEQKIIYKLLMSIDKDDADFKSYEFSVTEFKKMLGINDENAYKKLAKHTNDLMRKVVTFEDSEQKTTTQVAWISSAKYFHGQGIVRLKFDPEMKPHLLQLKTAFTKIDGHIAIQLKSGFSIRFNELLQQYIRLGERTLTVEDLRKKLGIQEYEYKQYYDFKKNVILKAQTEINNHPQLDLYFDFEEIKTGRRVTAIKFIIKRKFVESKEYEYNVNETNDLVPKEKIQGFITKFNTTHGANLAGTSQTKKIVADLINDKGLEHFENCLTKFAQVIGAEVKKGHIRSLEGLFMNFVKHGYNFNTHVLGQVGFEANFEQREYSAEDFEKYYYKVPENLE